MDGLSEWKREGGVGGRERWRERTVMNECQMILRPL